MRLARRNISPPAQFGGVMSFGAWREPVAVFAGRAGNTRWLVGDAARAATVLLSNWPESSPRGPKHLKAREMLLSCLQGKCDPEVARQAFIEAAIEADILVK